MYTTAHRAWDRAWRDASSRAAWSEPDAAVVEVAAALSERGARRALDVGSGVGRHSILLARSSFAVAACDASPVGCRVLRDAARAERLPMSVSRAAFTELPYAPATFDYVLAWNVLYHGDREVVRRAFGECARVVRRGGCLQLTMLSKRSRTFGAGREVAPDTFVVDGDTGDKGHPHFYVDPDATEALLAEAGFVLRSLDDVDQKPPRGAYHLVAVAQRR